MQAFYNPEKVIDDLLNVAEKAIITIPNFGFWKVRLDLLIKGTMPVTKIFQMNGIILQIYICAQSKIFLIFVQKKNKVI